MKRVLLIFFTFFVLTLVFSEKVLAADPFPSPAPIPCGSTKDPEFHSLRPYQASPCQTTIDSYAKFCGNNLTLHDTITETYPGNGDCTSANGVITCTYNEQVNKPITIDLSIASLPIMGNTEEATNSQNASESSEILDDAQKVNNYVSWYLNGVNYRAEYGDAKTDAGSLINFSGPLNKLLPSIILDAQRIKTINNAGSTNHNQIIVCGKNELGIVGDIAGLGTVTPEACYDGNGTSTKATAYRLEDWNGDLSIFNGLNDLLSKAVSNLSIIIPGGVDTAKIITDSIGNAWNDRKPPLPWDTRFKGNDKLYLKAYNEWRGKACALLPAFNLLICLDNPLVSKTWSNLYPYVPLSGTEDLKGGISIDSVSSATNPASGGVTVQNVGFSNQAPSTLFFPHMQESDELANLLQSTFVASGLDRAGSPTNVTSEISCKELEVRSNKGDNLFAKQLTGNISYNASFSCDFTPSTSTNNSSCMQDCLAGERAANESINCEVACSGSGVTSAQSCTKDIYISLSTTSSTPKVDDIWSRLVAGPASVFKRIFPKTNTVGGIGQIMDIPGSTEITYTGAGISQSETDLKFPHIGGVSEYFLKGIQTMLRPKGFGEPITFAPASSSSCKDASLPEIPPASEDACKLCSYPSNLPELMVDIFEAAAQAYNVPASVLYATFMHEGGTHNEWNDASALEWSVCGGEVPNCDKTGSTSQPPYGWFPVYFYNGYWDAVKVIDPERTQEETSPCNFLDATFATAKALSDFAGGRPVSARFPLSQDPSQAFSRIPDTCLGFDLNNDTGRPGSCSAWNTNTVVTSQVGYGGWCPEVGNHPIQPYFPDANEWIYQTVNFYQNYTCR